MPINPSQARLSPISTSRASLDQAPVRQTQAQAATSAANTADTFEDPVGKAETMAKNGKFGADATKAINEALDLDGDVGKGMQAVDKLLADGKITQQQADDLNAGFAGQMMRSSFFHQMMDKVKELLKKT